MSCSDTLARWGWKASSKRLASRYRSGRSPDWLKFKNPDAPAVKRGRRGLDTVIADIVALQCAR
jgi:hypothetical protein